MKRARHQHAVHAGVAEPAEIRVVPDAAAGQQAHTGRRATHGVERGEIGPLSLPTRARSSTSTSAAPCAAT